MNLVETIKSIGRDIKELFKRTDAIKKKVDGLNTTSDGSVDMTQIKQDINDLKSLKWFKETNSWNNYGSDVPHVWKGLEEATGDVGIPYANLPFYFVKNKEGGTIDFYGLDNPPFVIDPETKEATWAGDYEWINSISAESLLGFELAPVSEDSWDSYNERKNKADGNERRLVTRTFGDTKQQGLWYVDDDGHFRRLVDTIIELEKEILKLKEGKGENEND